MSQWERIRNGGLYDDVSGYYNDFPIEVRAVLAPWLEHHVLNSDLNPNNLEHLGFLQGFKNQMLEQLELFVNGITANDDQSIWFRQTLSAKYQLIAQNEPATMFRRIYNCLQQEKQHLMCVDVYAVPVLPDQQASSSPPQVDTFLVLKTRLHSGVTPRLAELKIKTKLMEKVVEELGSNLETANQIQSRINSFEFQQNGVTLTQLNEQMCTCTSLHQMKDQEFKRLTCELLHNVNDLLVELKDVHRVVLTEINTWNNEQRKAANGYPMPTNLDNLEELAKFIAGAVLECNQQLAEIHQLHNNEIIATNSQYPQEIQRYQQHLQKEIKDLFESLVTKTWVIERQPHQVLRSKTTPIKPGIKLRLLVGETLNRNETSVVKVSLINETEAKKLYEDHKYVPETTVELLNNKKTMRFDTETNTFSVELTGITLSEKIPRRSKRNPKLDASQSGQKKLQFVAEEKWCFSFTSEFSVLGHTFPLRAISCPVSITCHPNQDAAAWGTIIWDNAFATDSRVPFAVPKIVDCEVLLDNLNQKFSSMTGRGFTDRNRNMIRQKLLRNAPTSGQVSWDLFFTEPLEGITHPKSNTSNNNNKPKTVSFWEWLFAIMKLCEKTDDPKKSKENLHFQKFWGDGKIVGFISREEMTTTLMASKDPGTFMFRFSDTVLGSVTLIWCNYCREIQKYEPYTIEELKFIPLADRVLNKSELQYLYLANRISGHSQFENIHPGNMPKTVAFSATATENESKLKGYLRRRVNEVDDSKIIMRSRNDSTTSASTSWYTNSPYSQQSVATPTSGLMLPFSPNSGGSTTDLQYFGPQSHGSSGCQEIGVDNNSPADQVHPEVPNYYSSMPELMGDLGFYFDQFQKNCEED